jgi:DNA-binding MarR family transcriptional regulator
MAQPYYSVETLSPRISIGYLMKRIMRLTHARLDRAFRGADFTFTQWVALALIKSGVAETSSGLARDIGHDNGAMTRVVDQLVQRDLLERHPDPQDRRVTKLAVTGDGVDVLMQITPKVVDVWNEVLADFPRGDVDRFVTMLATIEGKLTAMEADKGEKADA